MPQRHQSRSLMERTRRYDNGNQYASPLRRRRLLRLHMLMLHRYVAATYVDAAMPVTIFYYLRYFIFRLLFFIALCQSIIQHTCFAIHCAC